MKASQDYCEKILENLPVVVQGNGKENEVLEHDSQPSLTDVSSIDSSIVCDNDSILSGSSRPKIRRRVSFTSIEIREYNLTVGDHPLCRDGLPLQLDWAHSPSTQVSILCSRERTEKYQMPRRLSYEEKRDRLIATADYADQRDRNHALGQVIQRMQSWWEAHPVLPMPNLYDIQEESPFDTPDENEEEHDFPEIDPPQLEEYVIHWRRNAGRKHGTC